MTMNKEKKVLAFVVCLLDDDLNARGWSEKKQTSGRK